MADRGSEFVFFKRRADITLEAAEQKIAAIPTIKVKRTGDALFVEDPSIDTKNRLLVHLNEEPGVAGEIADIVAEHAHDPRAKQAEGANARFELSWPLEEVDLINVVSSVRGRLEKLTGGVGFDYTGDEFRDPYP